MKRKTPGICFFLILSTLLWTVVYSDDLASDTAALLAIRDTLHGKTRQWNTAISPCDGWYGISCFNFRVTDLRLPGFGLMGQLPPGIGNLTQLQSLSLRFNSLTGTLPADFAKLSALRDFYIQGNRLSGPIPESLFALPNLERLNLAQNNFSGAIPAGINNSKKLIAIHLENNHLSGSIPEIDIPTLQQVNISNNNLTGSIPAKLAGMPASGFQGNTLCGAPLIPCHGSDGGGGGSGGGGGNNSTNSGDGDNGLSGGAIAGIIIAGVAFPLLLLALLGIFLRRKKKNKSGTRNIAAVKKKHKAGTAVPMEVKAMSESTDYSTVFSSGTISREAKAAGKKSLVFFGNGAREFDLEDLLRASAEVLGKGTFGTAYKATLDMGVFVAVKRLKDVTVPEKEFRERMQLIGSMTHENLVPLLAYYFSKDEKLIVFEYMSMGSLSALLHGNRGGGRTPLKWDTRIRVAFGAARGITYLHSQGSTVCHGNIKSSNILLSSSYEARVSDFCLAQLSGPTASPNRIDGYRAPEVTGAHKVSQKSDVFSFGVLLLELLTGKPPTHANEEGVDLPRWVQSTVQEEWSTEVFDMELLRYQSVEEDMVELLQLAVHCTAQFPDKRPSMAEVTSQIEILCRDSSPKDDVTDDSSHRGSVDLDAPVPSSVKE